MLSSEHQNKRPKLLFLLYKDSLYYVVITINIKAESNIHYCHRVCELLNDVCHRGSPLKLSIFLSLDIDTALKPAKKRNFMF